MSAFLLGILAESSIRTAILVAIFAAVLAVLRIRAASAQHTAWRAALCTMMLMPLLPYEVPAIGVPLSIPGLDLRITRDLDQESHAAIAREPGISTPARVVGTARAAQTRTTTAAVVPQVQKPAASWPDIALSIYIAGTLLFLTRGWLGWRKAARIGRRARCIDVNVEAPWLGIATDLVAIRESAAIVCPVTVGAIAPVILLPDTWRQWSESQLHAVLAHEIAHVHRRDPLVNVAAHVNRCLFWFHPAAWWLERTLAATAEQSCDEAAVRAVGAPERYAQLLVEMATAIRDRGGRLAWRGVGMDGNGLLSRRVDHVLRSASWSPTSPRRKAAAIICCSAATMVAVACRPQPNSQQNRSQAAVEQRDRKLRLDLEHVSIEQFASWTLRVADLPPAETLETAIARNPGELQALKTLLVSYWIEPPQDLTRRRSHIIWLIEHHPDVDLAGSVEARLFPNELDPSFPGDAAGYQQARALWLARANAPDATSHILGNAAAFFEVTDSPLAEQLFLRARASDPAGPWTARLGRLYAAVLAGSDAPRPQNRSRRLNAAAPQGALGLRIRKMLSESRDEELLTAAGWFLARGVRGPSVFRGFDPDRWAETCFRRALDVNPHAVLARTSLLEIHERMTWSRGEPLWSVPPAELYDSIASLPEAERFERLPALAREACRRIDSLARWNDDPLIRDRIELARQQARRFAKDALVLAPKYRAHPQYGTAIFFANMTLGTLALREGDRKTAVLFLRKAARAPSSEELAYSKGIASSHQWHLAGELLKQGERDAVLDFLDRMAAISLADGIELREAAAEVRRGGTPTLLGP